MAATRGGAYNIPPRCNFKNTAIYTYMFLFNQICVCVCQRGIDATIYQMSSGKVFNNKVNMCVHASANNLRDISNYIYYNEVIYCIFPSRRFCDAQDLWDVSITGDGARAIWLILNIYYVLLIFSLLSS